MHTHTHNIGHNKAYSYCKNLKLKTKNVAESIKVVWYTNYNTFVNKQLLSLDNTLAVVVIVPIWPVFDRDSANLFDGAPEM